jgi:hypothetical protein
MRGSRCQAAEHIEEEVAEMSNPTFHVVPKNIEEPHIAHKVQHTPMQKQRGEKGERLRGRRELCRDLWFGVPRRDKSVEINEFTKSSPLEQCNKKRQYGDGNGAVVDNRIFFRSIGIANRYHDVIRLTKYLDTVNDMASLPYLLSLQGISRFLSRE